MKSFSTLMNVVQLGTRFTKWDLTYLLIALFLLNQCRIFFLGNLDGSLHYLSRVSLEDRQVNVWRSERHFAFNDHNHTAYLQSFNQFWLGYMCMCRWNCLGKSILNRLPSTYRFVYILGVTHLRILPHTNSRFTLRVSTPKKVSTLCFDVNCQRQI